MDIDVNGRAAVLLVLAASLGLGGCLLQPEPVCPAVAEPAVSADFENEDGEVVKPDKVVFEHDGEEETENPTCPRPTAAGFYEGSSGSYTVRAECGDETVSETVQVSSGDCGPQTENVTLTFPTGACAICSGSGSPDAGTMSDVSEM